MRTLSRPMFRMGGPIKEGIMHGIREPKRNGGPTGTGLVGDQRYPQTGGREHHLFPLAPIGMAALRFLPAAIRGFRAARAYQPWAKNLGWTKRAKDILMPKGGLPGKGIAVGKAGPEQLLGGQAAGFRTGSFLKQNPITTLSLAPQAVAGGYKGGKYLTTEAAPAVGKAYVDALVPGESIFQGKTIQENIDPNTVRAGTKPGEGRKEGMYYEDPDKAKKLAKQKRDDRITNLLKTMGYDTAKKDAVSKALIDASQIVSDRGTLDKKNITAELINPIIQATSKRLEKPEQLNEAVRLMLTKAEIEKEMNPGSPTLQTAKDMVNTGAAKNIQDAMKKLTKQSTMADTLGAIKAKGNTIGADEIEIAYRIENPDVIPNKKIKGSNKAYKEWKNKNEGKTEMDFMTEIVSKGSDFGPGVYIIDKRAIVVDENENMAYEW